MAKPLWKWSHLAWLGIALVLLTLAGYGFTLGDFFLSDDFAALEMVVEAGSWRESLAPGGGFRQSWLRPLPNLFWWWNYQAFGLEPLGYRVTNALLHALNGWLLALLAGSLTSSRRVAVLAGAVFVVFPIHPEAVTWVCARYDLVCTTGVLAALLAWHAYVGPDGGAVQWIAAALATSAALASKEMAFALAPLLLILTWAGPRSRRAWVGLALLGLVFLGYFALRLELLGGFGGMPGEGGRLTSQLRPGRPSFVYHALTYGFVPTLRLPVGPAWLPLQILPVAAFGLGFVGIARRGWGAASFRSLGLALACFGASLLPIASWATFWGGHGTRYLYLPIAFSSLAMAIALERLAPRARAAQAAGAIAVLLPFFLGLLLLNGQWHTAATRARKMVESLPPVPPGTSFNVTGLPTHHGDAHLFLNGFRQAAHLCGGAEGRVRLLDQETWRMEAQGTARPGYRYAIWDSTAQGWASGPASGPAR